MIRIETLHGIKTINGRSLEQILEAHNSKDWELITMIFNHSNSEQTFIAELKKIKVTLTPVELLILIRNICKTNLLEAQPIFDKVMLGN
jgi:hypothetical protein